MVSDLKISAEREREIRLLVVTWVDARREALALAHETTEKPTSEAQDKRKAADEKACNLKSSLKSQLSTNEMTFARAVLDELAIVLIDPLASDD
jgi:hypothetical protein